MKKNMINETFQVGERVAYQNSSWDREIRIRTIERTTPTGLLVIGNHKFKPNGHCCGSGFHLPSIQKLTPEIEAQAIRDKNIRGIGFFAGNQIQGVSNTNIQRLADLVKEITTLEAEQLGKDKDESK